ncbi:39S ribosomal protein L33, mitochondrial [Habropoda laboriosa]|uniref:39S ribosomal protein L33, mitochondrial n=1 Tax=Habropoda laboriosa TaxID=597456 RepID=A0A0L7QXF5_9HYME|nr:PREDICTED: 39S ribosomal protein L33, mitochondrial [Habropoda laboriosa]KOC63241.1 39S ribosomal protein L33, mitochondrial [Habropoda laboriosa]
MFLTNVLLKKAKSKLVLVLLESVASGHKRVRFRERLADKQEITLFDPYVQDVVLYREIKKIKGIGP